MTKEDEFDCLKKRLDTIIQLLLENGPGAAHSVTDKITRLLEMGLTPVQTAEIVGKPTKYIWTVTGRKQKKSGAKKSKSKNQSVEAAPASDALAGDAT